MGSPLLKAAFWEALRKGDTEVIVQMKYTGEQLKS